MKRFLATTTVLTGVIGYANETGTELTAPMGRVVWGHPLKPRQKMGKVAGQRVPLMNKEGQPRMEIAFGLAIPTDQFTSLCWPAFAAEAMKMYTNGVPRDFSYKITQEHEMDKDNKPYGLREGYAGHVVVACSTEVSVSGFKFANGAYMQIGADDIKCGDYVMVGLNVKVHGGESPALYVNPTTVLLCYEGDAIAGSYNADPNATFGAAPVMAPPPPGARQIGAPAPAGQMPPQGAGMPGMGNGQMPGAGIAPGQGGFTATQPLAPAVAPMQQQPQGMPGMGTPMSGAPGVMPGQVNHAQGMQPATGAYPSNPQQMPPPATDFIPGAAPMQQPGMMPGGPVGGMPGMPGR